MSLEILLEEVHVEVMKLLDNCHLVSGIEVGLDRRVGNLYVSKDLDFIAIANPQIRMLDYYGGFEYVDDEYVITLGDYTFYLPDENRISGCLEYFEVNQLVD